MALGDFFSDNLPYGMAKDGNNEWQAFNREYLPLGFSKRDPAYDLNSDHKLPIRAKYRGLTENFILNLVDKPEMVRRNERGQIDRFWLYNGETNPNNKSGKESKRLWASYFEKLEKLGKLQAKMTI